MAQQKLSGEKCIFINTGWPAAATQRATAASLESLFVLEAALLSIAARDALRDGWAGNLPSFLMECPLVRKPDRVLGTHKHMHVSTIGLRLGATLVRVELDADPFGLVLRRHWVLLVGAQTLFMARAALETEMEFAKAFNLRRARLLVVREFSLRFRPWR